MIAETNLGVSNEGAIYTLAESGTQKPAKNSSVVIVSGEGTEICNNPSLVNRAKRKLISRKMILALIDVTKQKGEPERAKYYWNAYHCLNNVIVAKNKMYGKYCKSRFCTICNAIRKADTIKRYYPTISQWPDVHFVTLTVKACKEDKLNRWIFGMNRAFELIHNRCKKQHQRGKGIKLIGIKSLECNFNPERQTYNPHFHIIVPKKEIAELLVKEWLKQWKPKEKNAYKYKFTSPKAQHIEPINNLEMALIETIKYGSKVFTEPDLKKKGEKKVPATIYARALDNILVAMKGKRIFERFGFNLPQQPAKKSNSKLISDYEELIFPSDSTDWINPKTGETLTGYIPTSELSYLLNECINTERS